MKVYQGKPIKWIGPYQIAEMLCFWAKKVPDEYGFLSTPKWVYDFGTWLAKDKHGNDTMLMRICSWFHSRRKRKIEVKIDHYDIPEMYSNLAVIILPMLKKLKVSRHGSPFVDDEDVPEELRSTSAPKKENDWDVDDNWHRRWNWILDEMIWAFEQLQPDNNWEEEYFSGTADFEFVPCSWDENGTVKLYRMEKGPNHSFDWDEKGIDEHKKRIMRGTTLFGKYYQQLWN